MIQRMTSQHRGTPPFVLLSALVVALVFPVSSRAQSAPEMLEGVRVLSSTPGELVLEVTPRITLQRVGAGLLLPSVSSAVVINPSRPKGVLNQGTPAKGYGPCGV